MNTSRRGFDWFGTFGREAGWWTSTRRRISFTRLTASMQLDGGNVLPGFSVQVGELFEMPKRSAGKGDQKKNGPQPGKKNGRRKG